MLLYVRGDKSVLTMTLVIWYGFVMTYVSYMFIERLINF